jgi:hypothetical protein
MARRIVAIEVRKIVTVILHMAGIHTVLCVVATVVTPVMYVTQRAIMQSCMSHGAKLSMKRYRSA